MKHPFHNVEAVRRRAEAQRLVRRVGDALDVRELPSFGFGHRSVMWWGTQGLMAIESTAFRNSSLQGGYLILAARALGLDVGPMSGFDNAKVDAAFFAGTAIKSNFICNLGHGDPAKVRPRAPRLSFDEACRIV